MRGDGVEVAAAGERDGEIDDGMGEDDAAAEEERDGDGGVDEMGENDAAAEGDGEREGEAE